MTAQQSEGVLAAVCDFSALRELWEASETPLRRQLPLEQAGAELGMLYSRLEQLPGLLAPDVLAQLPAIVAPPEQASDDASHTYRGVDVGAHGRMSGEKESHVQKGLHAMERKDAPQPLSLDELEVVSSVTSRWPLDDVMLAYEIEEPDEIEALLRDAEGLTPGFDNDAGEDGRVDTATGGEESDETDEMDALPRKSD
jgi:hypothetical protein